MGRVRFALMYSLHMALCPGPLWCGWPLQASGGCDRKAFGDQPLRAVLQASAVHCSAASLSGALLVVWGRSGVALWTVTPKGLSGLWLRQCSALRFYSVVCCGALVVRWARWVFWGWSWAAWDLRTAWFAWEHEEIGEGAGGGGGDGVGGVEVGGMGRGGGEGGQGQVGQGGSVTADHLLTLHAWLLLLCNMSKHMLWSCFYQAATDLNRPRPTLAVTKAACKRINITEIAETALMTETRSFP